MARSVRPEVPEALALTAGSSSASAATLLARACSMRDAAAAMVGLAAWAASIISSSTGSLNCFHQSRSAAWATAGGGGASQAGGASSGGGDFSGMATGGAKAEQAPSSRLAAATPNEDGPSRHATLPCASRRRRSASTIASPYMTSRSHQRSSASGAVVELRRQLLDHVVADMHVHAQTGDAHRQALQLVVGLGQAEVAAEHGQQRFVHRLDAVCDFLFP